MKQLKASPQFAPRVEWILGFTLLGLLFLANATFAQREYGGKPYSFEQPTEQEVATTTLSALNHQALLEAERTSQIPGVPSPAQYGVERYLDLGLENAGLWEVLENGDGLWRLRLISPNAYSLNLVYDKFFMPPGARFFVYSVDRQHVLGAFTSKNNHDDLSFATMPTPGDEVVLEYYEPARVRGLGMLHISKVVHAYKDTFNQHASEEEGALSLGKTTGTNCYLGIKCSQASAFQAQKRAVVMIIKTNGTTCTGTLMNTTTSGSYTPYVLTARHCKQSEGDPGPGATLNWHFVFNYESSSCTGSSGSQSQSIYKATIKAHRSVSDTDFLLLQLTSAPPASYNSYYAGWDSRNLNPTDAYGIHHPEGLVKKFSRDLNYQNDPNNPLTSRFVAQFTDGMTEEGSSGSALFNQSKRVIGQLWGDVPWHIDLCSLDKDWYGKLSSSWNGASSTDRLKDWLAPGSSTTYIDGKEGPAATLNVTLSGPTSVPVGQADTWTATVTGGQGSYAYNWEYRAATSSTWLNGNLSAIGNKFTKAFSQSSYIRVTVTSGDGQVDSDLWYVVTTGFGQAAKVLGHEEGPSKLMLYLNYPNPFNPSTDIRFSLARDTELSLDIFDLQGRLIQRLFEGQLPKGEHQIRFEASGLPGGVYLYRLRTSDGIHTRRMTLLK